MLQQRRSNSKLPPRSGQNKERRSNTTTTNLCGVKNLTTTKAGTHTELSTSIQQTLKKCHQLQLRKNNAKSRDRSLPGSGRMILTRNFKAKSSVERINSFNSKNQISTYIARKRVAKSICAVSSQTFTQIQQKSVATFDSFVVRPNHNAGTGKVSVEHHLRNGRASVEFTVNLSSTNAVLVNGNNSSGAGSDVKTSTSLDSASVDGLITNSIESENEELVVASRQLVVASKNQVEDGPSTDIAPKDLEDTARAYIVSQEITTDATSTLRTEIAKEPVGNNDLTLPFLVPVAVVSSTSSTVYHQSTIGADDMLGHIADVDSESADDAKYQSKKKQKLEAADKNVLAKAAVQEEPKKIPKMDKGQRSPPSKPVTRLSRDTQERRAEKKEIVMIPLRSFQSPGQDSDDDGGVPLRCEVTSTKQKGCIKLTKCAPVVQSSKCAPVVQSSMSVQSKLPPCSCHMHVRCKCQVHHMAVACTRQCTRGQPPTRQFGNTAPKCSCGILQEKHAGNRVICKCRMIQQQQQCTPRTTKDVCQQKQCAHIHTAAMGMCQQQQCTPQHTTIGMYQQQCSTTHTTVGMCQNQHYPPKTTPVSSCRCGHAECLGRNDQPQKRQDQHQSRGHEDVQHTTTKPVFYAKAKKSVSFSDSDVSAIHVYRKHPSDSDDDFLPAAERENRKIGLTEDGKSVHPNAAKDYTTNQKRKQCQQQDKDQKVAGVSCRPKKTVSFSGSEVSTIHRYQRESSDSEIDLERMKGMTQEGKTLHPASGSSQSLIRVQTHPKHAQLNADTSGQPKQSQTHHRPTKSVSFSGSDVSAVHRYEKCSSSSSEFDEFENQKRKQGMTKDGKTVHPEHSGSLLIGVKADVAESTDSSILKKLAKSDKKERVLSKRRVSFDESVSSLIIPISDSEYEIGQSTLDDRREHKHRLAGMTKDGKSLHPSASSSDDAGQFLVKRNSKQTDVHKDEPKKKKEKQEEANEHTQDQAEHEQGKMLNKVSGNCGELSKSCKTQLKQGDNPGCKQVQGTRCEQHYQFNRLPVEIPKLICHCETKGCRQCCCGSSADKELDLVCECCQVFAPREQDHRYRGTQGLCETNKCEEFRGCAFGYPSRAGHSKVCTKRYVQCNGCCEEYMTKATCKRDKRQPCEALKGKDKVRCVEIEFDEDCEDDHSYYEDHAERTHAVYNKEMKWISEALTEALDEIMAESRFQKNMHANSPQTQQQHTTMFTAQCEGMARCLFAQLGQMLCKIGNMEELCKMILVNGKEAAIRKFIQTADAGQTALLNSGQIPQPNTVQTPLSINGQTPLFSGQEYIDVSMCTPVHRSTIQRGQNKQKTEKNHQEAVQPIVYTSTSKKVQSKLVKKKPNETIPEDCPDDSQNEPEENEFNALIDEGKKQNQPIENEGDWVYEPEESLNSMSGARCASCSKAMKKEIRNQLCYSLQHKFDLTIEELHRLCEDVIDRSSHCHPPLTGQEVHQLGVTAVNSVQSDLQAGKLNELCRMMMIEAYHNAHKDNQSQELFQ